MLKFVRTGYGDDIFLESDIQPKYAFNDLYLSAEVDGGKLVVANTNIENVYHYGLISNRHSLGHGPGYVWSSRVGCLNLEFGTDFVEVVINNCAGYCMSAQELIKLFPEGCYFERYEQFDDKEPYYKLRGFYTLSWFSLNGDVHQFNTSESIEVTDNLEIVDGAFTLKSTNYEGVYVFDTPEMLLTKYTAPYYHRSKRETKWDDAPKSIKNEYVEIYVDYKYGYCASKQMLKENFPEKFKNIF